MIGIVIVCHGKLADAFAAVTEHVVGKQVQLRAVGIEADADADTARSCILHAIKEVDAGKGVVILTDMFGGTPSNLAISAMNRDDVEVIAGVNLPMIIKLASVRSSASLADAVSQAQDAARKYIHVAGHFLEKDSKKA